ncbi:unnamed protein product [Auanema sp. JU1783]|nr:unnamed protein product [Auanema sp. JU1783]
MASTSLPPAIIISSCRSAHEMAFSDDEMETNGLRTINRPIYSTKRWQTMTSLRQPSTPINVYGRSTDADSHYIGYTPTHTIDTPRTPVTSGQRSRFLEGFRRRRLQSENIPRSSLDEDLGYPPVCTPPPDICLDLSQSAPERPASCIRTRSVSETSQFHQGHQGLTVVHKRQSGVLVVFPHSPSLNGHTLSTDGKINYSGCMSSKSYDGVIPSMSPRENNNSRASPRRPLFVDTQLANGQKRSPVGSMMDFVRGRNRTTSCSLTGSSSGPNTPSSPQSVFARCSASVDGSSATPMSPVFSPSNRPFLKHYHRSGYHRSVDSDSGLGLGSPSIGHTALLIREVR